MDLLLCRIHVTKGPQLLAPFSDFFGMSPGEILRKTIVSKPNVTIRQKNVWSVANIEEIDDRTIFFHMGCEKVKKEGIKDIDGNFTEEERPVAPHTRVILDWSLEICAIEPHSELGSIKTLAARLDYILNNSGFARSTETVFEVLPIDNPEEFVEWIHGSYMVQSFQFTFSDPNFEDIEEDIQKPLEGMARKLHSNDNQIKFQNKQGLKKDRLTELSRAIIAAGQKIEAKCKADLGATSEKRTSTGNLSFVHVDALESEEDKEQAAFRMRWKYKEIRYGEKS